MPASRRCSPSRTNGTQYPWYHSTNDLPQYLTVAMGAEDHQDEHRRDGRSGGATLGIDFADGFESGDTTAWSLTIP